MTSTNKPTKKHFLNAVNWKFSTFLIIRYARKEDWNHVEPFLREAIGRSTAIELTYTAVTTIKKTPQTSFTLVYFKAAILK